MRVRLSVFGPLRAPRGVRDGVIELADGASVGDALAQQFHLTAAECAHLILQINQQSAGVASCLHDGDELTVFLPVGGGM